MSGTETTWLAAERKGFVAPASRRRSYTVLGDKKIAGETPALQNNAA